MSTNLKREAAAMALEHVRSGMKLGLGTGSTAEEFVKLLGEKVAGGLHVVCVPTSERTAVLAGSLGIPLTTLENCPELDLTVDGADEIGPRLVLVKGGGGALLREKIVAAASKQMLVIADASKLVETVGAFPLPIEVVPFGLETTRRAIVAKAAALGLSGNIVLRRLANGEPYLTDGQHLILDASFRRIPEPEALADALATIPGVVEHGLFIGIATEALVASPERVISLSK